MIARDRMSADVDLSELHGRRAAVYRRDVRFRVLGPLDVDTGNGPVPLGGPKQRTVLAHLVLNVGRVVPTEQLIDALWGEDPPEAARNTLQSYVSNLRKAVGGDVLGRRPPGYVLSVDAAQVDTARFEALVRDARRSAATDPAGSLALLDEALALWRGPALADVADQPSLVGEAARLDELHLAALEERIEALLTLGDHARAIGELERLVAQHPLREHLWGNLMLALYRDGRQSEALDTFRRARETLADELGVDPSHELVRRHEQILRQDPALELRGEPLRGYRLLERIGEGSIGTVFRALQPHVGRDVAIKVIHERVAADPGFARRFESEAQAATALEHPHIVPIHDHWREPQAAYVVSRYMRGGSLGAVLERGDDWTRPGPARSSDRSPRRWRTPTAGGSRTGTSRPRTSCSTNRATPTSATSRSRSAHPRNPPTTCVRSTRSQAGCSSHACPATAATRPTRSGASRRGTYGTPTRVSGRSSRPTRTTSSDASDWSSV
jgi:DNA-binding SARP family transcriptional activator